MTLRIDWDAIRAGGAVALVFAVPLSLAARWAADNDDSGLAVGAHPRCGRRVPPRRWLSRPGCSASTRR